jgi:Pilus assembly protein, PilO
VAGYFLVISPQRGKAAELKKSIADTQKQIDDARALVAKAKNAQKVKVADIFKLTKAMPDAPDEAGVLLDLNTIAERSGIKFDSLSVDPSTTLTNYQVIPLRLEFHGNFYDLADFLFRLRNLVDVHRGALDARGRLFAVDKLALDEGIYVFPQIRAQVTIVAFVYGIGQPGDTAPPQSASATGSGTSSTTTSSPTTTTSTAAPSGNATAAGATP